MNFYNEDLCSLDFEEAIIKSINNNNLKEFKYYVSKYKFDLEVKECVIFFELIKSNKIDMLKIILKQEEFNPDVKNNTCVIACMNHDNYEAFKLFYYHPKCLETIDKGLSFQFSALKGEIRYLKHFMQTEKINKSENNNSAIKEVFKNRNYECTKLLFDNKDVYNSLKSNNPELFKEISLFLNVNYF